MEFKNEMFKWYGQRLKRYKQLITNEYNSLFYVELEHNEVELVNFMKSPVTGVVVASLQRRGKSTTEDLKAIGNMYRYIRDTK